MCVILIQISYLFKTPTWSSVGLVIQSRVVASGQYDTWILTPTCVFWFGRPWFGSQVKKTYQNEWRNKFPVKRGTTKFPSI